MKNSPNNYDILFMFELFSLQIKIPPSKKNPWVCPCHCFRGNRRKIQKNISIDFMPPLEATLPNDVNGALLKPPRFRVMFIKSHHNGGAIVDRYLAYSLHTLRAASPRSGDRREIFRNSFSKHWGRCTLCDEKLKRFFFF